MMHMMFDDKLSLEDAAKIAREHKPDIDNFIEYEDAFVFGCAGDSFRVETSSCVVLKETGEVISMEAYLGMQGTNHIKAGRLA